MGAIWAPFWGPLAEEVRWRQRGADVSGFVSSPCEVGEGGCQTSDILLSFVVSGVVVSRVQGWLSGVFGGVDTLGCPRSRSKVMPPPSVAREHQGRGQRLS